MVDNSKAVRLLGLKFRSDEECFLELADQLLEIERRTRDADRLQDVQK